MNSLLSQNIQSLGYLADVEPQDETPLIDIYADVASENSFDLSALNALKRLYTVAYRKTPSLLGSQVVCGFCECLMRQPRN